MLVHSENISFCGYVFFYLFLNLFSCLFSHSVKVIYGPPLSVLTHSEGANFDDDCSVSMECTSASCLDGGGGKPVGTSCWWLCWALIEFLGPRLVSPAPFTAQGVFRKQTSKSWWDNSCFVLFLRCDNLLTKQRNSSNFIFFKSAVFKLELCMRLVA